MQKLRFLVLVLIILLAACQGDSDDPPQPQPPTAQQQVGAATLPPPTPEPIIVTRTPRPAVEPTATGTPSEELIPYAGTWTLLLRYELTDNEQIPVHTIIYSTSAPLTVGIDGSVFAVGSFSASFQSADCAVEPAETEALKYTMTGRVEIVDGNAVMTVNTTPFDAAAAEQYMISCVDKLNTSERTTTEWNQPFLFPLLDAANQSQTRLNIVSFSARPEPQIIDFSTLATSFTGQLAVEAYLSR